MTYDEALKQLQRIIDQDGWDVEIEHELCDNILVAVCRVMGANDIADKYEESRNKVGFWYA